MSREKVAECLSRAFQRVKPVIENYEDYFAASVLIPLVFNKKGLSILFEVRASTLNWQPGEICFPGGRIEEGEMPEDTAVRETVEELNIAAEDIEIITSLKKLIAPIGVIVYPYLGIIENHTDLKPNAEEVAEYFTVPLKYLINIEPQIAHLEVATQPLADFPFHLLDNYQRDWKKRTKYPVYFYEYDKYVIWGLTARVLYSCLQVIKQNCELNDLIDGW